MGDTSVVPLLAEVAASEDRAFAEAARLSLDTMRGDDVDAAIVATLPKVDAGGRAELLRALANRRASRLRKLQRGARPRVGSRQRAPFSARGAGRSCVAGRAGA